MSTLVLIRHGQASIHRADYDLLSTVGVEQSRALGRYLAGQSRAVDALYSGSQKRHVDTAAELRSAAEQAGRELPSAEVDQGFDELDIRFLVAEAMKRVLPMCPDFREQLAAGQLDDEGRTARKHMMGIFGKLIERWAGGESFEGVEAFVDFEARVRAAMVRVMRAQGRGKRVVVVSSGGPISVMTRLPLSIPASKTAAIMFELDNASLTELRYTEDRLGLARFNTVAHLPQELVTRI